MDKQATTARSTKRMEFIMSIKTKIATLAIATLAITGSIAASTQDAHAGPKGKAIAAGLLGAAVVGTAIAASTAPGYGYGYGYGHRHCSWQPQYNVFGQWVGNARVCHFH
jgi:hypothetical protein